MQNKMILVLALVGTIGVTPAFATTYDDISHSQGNGFQCATGPTQQLECQIENILLYFFPQFIKIGQNQDAGLKQIISNQQTEIQLLQKIDRDLCVAKNC